MIIQIRKYLNTRLFKGVIIFLCLVMAGVFSIPLLLKQDSRPWVFKINGTLVSHNNFDYEVAQQQEQLQQFKQHYGQLSDYLLKSMNMSSDPRVLATQKLQQDILLRNFGERNNLRVNKKNAIVMVNNPLSEGVIQLVLPQYLFNEDGTINQYGVKAFLQQKHITIDGLYSEVAQELSRLLISSLIKIAGSLPDTMVDQLAMGQEGGKAFNYVLFDLKKTRAKAMQEEPSEATLLNYFDTNKDRWLIPEKRHISLWTFNPSTYNIIIDEKEYVKFYEKNKNTLFVKDQVLTTIRQIVYKGTPLNKPSIADLKEELLKNPESFSEKAKLFSDDKESAQKGGLLKPFARKTLNPIIEKAAFALEKEGDISDVIPLEDGFAIIQLVQRTPKTFVPIEQVRKEIESRLYKQRFIEIFEKEAKEALDNNTLDAFAKRHKSLFIKEEKMFNKQDPLALKVFSLNSGEFFVGLIQDKGYIVKIDNKIAQKMPLLSEVRALVVKQWQEEQAHLLLNSQITEFKKALKDNSFEQVAEKNDLPINKTTVLKRSDEETLKKLEKNGLPIAQMLDLFVPGTIAIGFNGSVGCIAQLSFVRPEKTSSAEELHALRAAILEQNKRSLVRGLIASLNKDAKIEYNESSPIDIENYIL